MTVIFSNLKGKSDNLISMKRISATEAARNFSTLLDEVENTSESFEITRGKQVIAVISAPVATDLGLLQLRLDAIEAPAEWEHKTWEELRDAIRNDGDYVLDRFERGTE